jgi:hypothetical protein
MRFNLSPPSSVDGAKNFRGELLDRTLIWNQTHLLHALRECERHYNEHRTYRPLADAAPLRVRPQPVKTRSDRTPHLRSA